MFKLIGKISSLIICAQVAFAVPTQGEVIAEQTAIVNEFRGIYNKSSVEMQKKGLVAFFAVYGDLLNEQDQAFLGGKLKGLNALPKISSPTPTTLEIQNMVNGVNHPIKFEIADASAQRFLINGKPIKVDEIDGIEEVYKKVSVALGQKLSATDSSSWIINRLSEIIIPRANAFDAQDWKVGALVLTAVAIVSYFIGKKRGKKQAQKLYNEQQATPNVPPIQYGISESNPAYLLNPSTDTSSTTGVDHSSDVITPVH